MADEDYVYVAFFENEDGEVQTVRALDNVWIGRVSREVSRWLNALPSELVASKVRWGRKLA
jgi:hypothetical protein